MKEILQEFDESCEADEHKNEFRKAEKSAFERICEAKPDLIAENLAKLFGFYLSKTSKIKEIKTEEEIEKEVLTDLMEMFRCIKSTDIFSSFYK